MKDSLHFYGAHNEFVLPSAEEHVVIEHAVAASAALASASAVVKTGVDGIALLGWCFSLVSINIGVFGFIYSIYANARMTQQSHLAIVDILVYFCTLLAVIIIVLTGLALYISYIENVRWEVFLIIGCLAVVVAYVGYLAKKMHTPEVGQ